MSKGPSKSAKQIKFVFSDPHFDQESILTFKDQFGKPLRPFKTLEEMNETMVNNWNNVVREQDQVYLLGDVAFHKTGLAILERLNGNIILVRGNHDRCKLSHYLPYVNDIRGYPIYSKCIMSHIPIHPESLGKWKLNIHGHLHSNDIGQNTPEGIDPRFVNVSVEKINYTPVNLDKLIYDNLEIVKAWNSAKLNTAIGSVDLMK